MVTPKVKRISITCAILGFIALAMVYRGYLTYVYQYHYFQVANGALSNDPTGVYVVSVISNYQIPNVLRERTITLARRNGIYCVTDSKGNSLPLIEGRDGLYFTEDFRPTGATILPGIVRHWNEGRISLDGDRLMIEGKMLEKGLMLGVSPLHKVLDWNVTFVKATTDATESSDKPDGEEWAQPVDRGK